MEEMAGLYAMLANGGVLKPLVTTVTPPDLIGRGIKLLSPRASYVVLEM